MDQPTYPYLLIVSSMTFKAFSTGRRMCALSGRAIMACNFCHRSSNGNRSKGTTFSTTLKKGREILKLAESGNNRESGFFFSCAIAGVTHQNQILLKRLGIACYYSCFIASCSLAHRARRLPSARLTLHSTKRSTSSKFLGKKKNIYIYLLVLSSEAFLSISQKLKEKRLQGGAQTKL